VASPKKEVSKKSAKKARKPPPAVSASVKKKREQAAKAAAKAAAKKKRERAAKAAAKAAAKKARKANKRGTKKAVKKTAAPRKVSKKPAKKPAKKTTKPNRRSSPPSKVSVETAPSTAVVKKPVAKPKAATSKATVAAPAKPIPAPARGNTFYITTAIAYPNGVPHIGHAYEAIATDALARFARLDGNDVFFLTGTDEHGLKMVQTAQNEGTTPEALAERNANQFKEMDRRLNVWFSRFIRTTEPQHHRSSQEIWQRMADHGDIYLDSYAGWYSVRDEAYYAEDETTLGDDQVRRGPQGTPVEWVEEKSYFFRLSNYQKKLLAHYKKRPNFIGPESRKNEVISFVKSGLRDLSISRTNFSWGVKVPKDAEHVMYVWVDALTNYITGVGFPNEKDPNWRYWPADVHIIGKDIIRFHAVYWPAFLMSAGIKLPKRVYAHGFLFNRGEKMSKSVGNVLDPFNLADQYGVDQMRYFFLREVPFGQDGNYNHEVIVARINADLANDLGNLAQRSLSMINKQLGGLLSKPRKYSDNDKAILKAAKEMILLARKAMKTQQIHQALNAIWAVIADANRYFAGEAPWALAKTDPIRQKTVLYVTAEVLRRVAILAQPFIPQSAGKLLDLLEVPIAERDFNSLNKSLGGGVTLRPPSAIFPRYVEPKETPSDPS